MDVISLKCCLTLTLGSEPLTSVMIFLVFDSALEKRTALERAQCMWDTGQLQKLILTLRQNSAITGLSHLRLVHSIYVTGNLCCDFRMRPITAVKLVWKSYFFLL